MELIALLITAYCQAFKHSSHWLCVSIEWSLSVGIGDHVTREGGGNVIRGRGIVMLGYFEVCLVVVCRLEALLYKLVCNVQSKYNFSMCHANQDFIERCSKPQEHHFLNFTSQGY